MWRGSERTRIHFNKKQTKRTITAFTTSFMKVCILGKYLWITCSNTTIAEDNFMTELTASKEQYDKQSDKGHNDGFHNSVYEGKWVEFSFFIANSCKEQLYDRAEENTAVKKWQVIFTLFRIWNYWSVWKDVPSWLQLCKYS